MDKCIFCKIVKGEIPSEKLYEDGKSIVFLDIAPVNHGHVLVVSKDHYENLQETPEEIACHLLAVAKKIAPVIAKATNAAGFNLGVNNGSAAGQAVFHVHYHVIPRFHSDGLKLWPQKKYKEDEMQKVGSKIRVLLQ